MSFDRSKRKFMIVAMLLVCNSGIWAQNQVECHLKADFVSNYIWRGQDLGNVSLQPELSVAWKGLSLAAWGSVGLSRSSDAREIDLTLTYETGGLSFGIVDYWSEGNDDYQEDDGEYQSSNDKRAYSSYFGLSAPFRLATCDWEAEVGFVPWKSATYEVSSFNVTNLSLRATKAIQISQSFELPLFGQVIANPASQHFYFVFGFTLQAL